VALIVVNTLTLLRFALAAAYPLAPPELRVPIVVTAATSDFLDGVIARRFAGGSWIGGLLDAVADKVFVGVVLVSAVLDGSLDGRWLGPLLARDVVVLGIAAFVASHRRWDAFQRMPSQPLGKATTAVMFALFLVLVLAPERTALSVPLAVVGSATSVLAGIDYLMRFVRAWRAERVR